MRTVNLLNNKYRYLIVYFYCPYLIMPKNI